jgi:ribosome biogenesis GTPase
LADAEKEPYMTIYADIPTLNVLGWKNFFMQGLIGINQDVKTDVPYSQATPAKSMRVVRVTAVQRTGLQVAPRLSTGSDKVPLSGKWFRGPEESRPTVGDWVLVDAYSGALTHILPRLSLIKRLSPSGGGVQLIAANVDAAFIVTSCNTDFSPARLERYLSVVMDSGIEPVLILTKSDLAAEVETFQDELQAQFRNISSFVVNALDEDSVAPLLPWCVSGQTIALLGSSGVGKSTLVNTLTGQQVQFTQSVRVEDDKGRHTTTHRSLHKLPQGGVILDSPGMRELQIAEAEEGVDLLFADVDKLAQMCRFNDCAHQAEPGCAVRLAVNDGELDTRRLESYSKLKIEEAMNRGSVSQRYNRERQFGKKVKTSSSDKHRKKALED